MCVILGQGINSVFVCLLDGHLVLASSRVTNALTVSSSVRLSLTLCVVRELGAQPAALQRAMDSYWSAVQHTPHTYPETH